MPKLMVMYPQPTDAAVFDKRYAGEHLPMADKLLTRVSKVTISPSLLHI